MSRGELIPCYLDAVRHMRPGQIAGRSRRLIPPTLLATGLHEQSTAAFTSHAAGLGADPAPQSGPVPDPFESGTFVAYGHARDALDERLWEPGPEGLLFMFHLHSFAPLATYCSGPRTPQQDQFWARMVESWLRAAVRPSVPAWHPYPTSLRLIAWCSALGAIETWSGALRRRVAGEIARQARYLRRAVEHDIGGNHVLKNATALLFAGVAVPDAGGFEFSLRLLQRELARQILADGAHEERSTSYHREVSTDLVYLAALLERAAKPVPGWLEEASARMERWQRKVAGPGGNLPMLGDAWEGPPLAGVARRHEDVTALSASGHVVLRSGDDQLVFDCGAICPDHLPAHAHADALSFVLWVDGQPLIVDRGAFTYTGPERAVFRATAAHSTVEVDGEDQCVFWGDFRASFLPKVESPKVRTTDGLVVVESSHTGYRRLSDPVVHHRAIVWRPGDGAIVVDRLRCRRVHDVCVRLQLAPGVSVRDGRAGSLKIVPLAGAAAIEETFHAPFLGSRVAANTLATRLEVGSGTAFGWSMLRQGTARLASDGVIEVATGRETLRVPLRPLG